MYSKSQILAATGLYTRIGLREPTKSGYTGILDTPSKTTKSGFYYDKYHTLATFINLYDCQNDSDITDSEINAEIVKWRQDAIETGLALVFNDKPDLLENELLFNNENVFNDTIDNNSKFVGYEISVPKSDLILNVLNSAILQFDGAATFNLYLFHSSKKEAIGTFSVTTVADDFYKVSLAQSIYHKSSIYASGKFYLGYFQDDIGSVKAYSREWSNASNQTKYKCTELRSIRVEPNGTNLFDIDEIEYTSECWGLNLDISSYNDYTNLILNNQAMFDAVQGYAFAIKVLELIKTTGRINPTQKVNEKLPDIANYDLNDQTEPYSRGLYTKLKIEVNGVRKSLFNDSRVIKGTAI